LPDQRHLCLPLSFLVPSLKLEPACCKINKGEAFRLKADRL